MEVYRIKNWDKHFEISQSRRTNKSGETQRNHWVAIPNKHDGKGFRRLMRRENGPALFAAWVLIVQVASKCPIRGVLFDDDSPLTAEDLAVKTDCPTAIFKDAMRILASHEVGWLEIVDESVALSALGARCGYITGQDITEQDTSCGETAEPSSPLAAIEAFPCDGNEPEWRLSQAKLDEYRKVYPSLDVLQECHKARQWLLDNPARRKTSSGMMRYLGNWLSKAQNTSRASKPAANSVRTAEDRKIARQASENLQSEMRKAAAARDAELAAGTAKSLAEIQAERGSPLARRNRG